MTTYSCDAPSEPPQSPTLLSQTLMVGKWSGHAYHRSPDGKTLIHHELDGIRVQRGKTSVKYVIQLRGYARDFEFSPTHPERVVFLRAEPNATGSRVALLDLSELSAKPSLRVVYTPTKGDSPYQVSWGAAGDVLWVLSSRKGDSEGAPPIHLWHQVRLADGHVSEVASAPEVKFMAPYLDPKTKRSKFVYGDAAGIHLVDPTKPGVPLLLSRVVIGSKRTHDRTWTYAKGRNHLALAFTSDRMKGVYLVDIERLVAARAKAKAPARDDYDRDAFDRVSRTPSVHTLWFSPRGTYLTGADKAVIFLRRTRDPREKPTRFEIMDTERLQLRRVRGVRWNEAETKLAVIVDNEIWVYDWTAPWKENAGRSEGPGLDQLEALTGKRPRLRRVAKVPHGFLAEPQWLGDRLVFSQFEDVKIGHRTRGPMKIPPLPTPTPSPTPGRKR